jgi:hypothetical protein
MLSRLFGYKRTTLLTLAEDFPEITNWKEFILLQEDSNFASLKGKVFKSHKQFLKEIEKNIDKTIKEKINTLKKVKKTRPIRHKHTLNQTHKDYLDNFHEEIKKLNKHTKTETKILEYLWIGKLNNDILELKTNNIKLRLQKHN